MLFLFFTDVNGCSSSPCKNGATCVNEVKAYKCLCVAGYTGVDCETGVSLLSNVQLSYLCGISNWSLTIYVSLVLEVYII